MSMIRLQSLSSGEVTVLSNDFIDTIMPAANGEFVKIYIYLLRLLGGHTLSLSLEEMADRLRCTVGDIMRALKYWAGEGLLALETDSRGELTGITLPESPSGRSAAFLSGREASATASIAPNGDPSGERQDRSREPGEGFSHSAGRRPDDGFSHAADRGAGHGSAQGAASDDGSDSSTSSGTSRRNRRTVSPARIKELKENEEVVQLLYIAEQYLGKALSPTEIQKILFFYDELKMSVDLIDHLIQYCVGRGHKSMRYIETVAMAWAEENITTVEMAKESVSRYSRDYFAVLKAMGITTRNPIDTEISMIDTWKKDYGFSMELILEACRRTVMQTGQPSFQYADKILAGWLKNGVHGMDDIRVLDARHQKRRQDTAASRTPAPKNQNRFNNFHQREYDFDEYEKILLNR